MCGVLFPYTKYYIPDYHNRIRSFASYLSMEFRKVLKYIPHYTLSWSTTSITLACWETESRLSTKWANWSPVQSILHLHHSSTTTCSAKIFIGLRAQYMSKRDWPYDSPWLLSHRKSKGTLSLMSSCPLLIPYCLSGVWFVEQDERTVICFIGYMTVRQGYANIPIVGISIEAIGQCEMSSHCTENQFQQVFKLSCRWQRLWLLVLPYFVI